MMPDELEELHQGILAYWDALGQDHPPTPEWKRWAMQLLFGVPLLLDGEEPQEPLTHPAFIVAEGADVVSMIAFHIDALNANPSGPIARALWKRLYALAGDVLSAFELLDSQEEAA